MTLTSATDPATIRRQLSLVAVLSLAIIGTAFWLTSGETPDPSRPVSLLLGAALGFTFERGRFCFFCLFRDSIEQRATRPLIAIVVAIAVGAVGYALTFGLYLPNPK
ncbi:MAG: YeeE/YedE family protein, partial [Actinomycetota bacterium]